MFYRPISEYSNLDLIIFRQIVSLNSLQNKLYDICVVGGGPAGITAAVKLHRLGFKTLLIDSGNRSNQPDVQSVSPAVLMLLTGIGLNTEQIQKCLRPIQVTRKLWTDESEEIGRPPGFLIHRSMFDNELLHAAKRLEIQVMQPASVMSCRHLHENWELQINQGGKYSVLKTKFLVDASGRKSVLRDTKIRVGSQTVAITGCWENRKLPKKSTWLESASTHWLWGAKISDKFFHITVFTDPSAIGGRSRLMKQYVSAIERTILFRDCLQGPVPEKLTVVDVTPYYYQHPVSRNFIKTGEASAGLDPLSSQGIQNTIAGAMQAAIVVNTLISKTGLVNNALEFYSSRQQESVRNHLHHLSKNYSSAAHWQDQPFWKKRTMNGKDSILNLPVDVPSWNPEKMIKLSPDLILKSVACIEGDLITSKTGLIHPGLERPMVYWQNLEMKKLIETVTGNITFTELIREWSGIMPPPNAVQLINTLHRAGVLEIVS
jgi:flavin-dependent dehydrogenase